MGFSHNCNGRLRHLHLIVLVLLISSSTHCRYMAQGRTDFKLLNHQVSSQVGGEVKAIVRSQIGSRPPRCDRKCRTCGHCEAVQVPAVPLSKSKSKSNSKTSSKHSTVSMRGEDGSNYKPMSWKCKCGDMMFNP